MSVTRNMRASSRSQSHHGNPSFAALAAGGIGGRRTGWGAGACRCRFVGFAVCSSAGFAVSREGSYNYTDGLEPNGQLNAGLLFVSYQNDPQNFIRLQNRLGAHDLLNEYIRHIGSAIFAVPPAPNQGHYIGQSLFL